MSVSSVSSASPAQATTPVQPAQPPRRKDDDADEKAQVQSSAPKPPPGMGQNVDIRA